METVQMDRLDFFWSFFIYNTLHLELQINFYDFLKFVVFSGISCVEIIPVNNLLRQQYVRMTSVVNGAGPGQTDQWVLHVSS